jgi:lactate racemase
MKVSLAYGRNNLDIEVPDNTTVIEPSHMTPVPDERAAVVEALDNPIGATPLKKQISATTRICIVHTDITRATPNDRLIPWILSYLESAGATRENITLLNGLGTHRPNTIAELETMLTKEVVANYRCLNHEPENDDEHVQFGVTKNGTPALINKHLAEAPFLCGIQRRAQGNHARSRCVKDRHEQPWCGKYRRSQEHLWDQ